MDDTTLNLSKVSENNISRDKFHSVKYLLYLPEFILNIYSLCNGSHEFLGIFYNSNKILTHTILTVIDKLSQSLPH